MLVVTHSIYDPFQYHQCFPTFICFPSDFFPADFYTKIVHTFSISPK